MGSKKSATNGVGLSDIPLWKKIMVSESEWTDKDEFLDAVYWIRQIIGLVIGILWGFFLLQGFIGLSTFLLTNCFIIYLFTTTYQNVDDEEYGGMSEILKEGMMSSFATFMVSWIIVYSAKVENLDIPL